MPADARFVWDRMKDASTTPGRRSADGRSESGTEDEAALLQAVTDCLHALDSESALYEPKRVGRRISRMLAERR
jgi:hypothetical protein